jgi:hypothetical protein
MVADGFLRHPQSEFHPVARYQTPSGRKDLGIFRFAGHGFSIGKPTSIDAYLPWRRRRRTGIEPHDGAGCRPQAAAAPSGDRAIPSPRRPFAPPRLPRAAGFA